MKAHIPLQIWTLSKPTVYFNIGLISIINLIGLAITIIFWQELSVLHKSGLLGSFFLTIPFLLMYVMNCTVTRDGIVFSMPHKKVKMQFADIESARIIKKLSNEYLEIRTIKAIGIRRRFLFLIEENKFAVTETLNDFMNRGLKVYTNSTLETQVRYNSETKKFECN